MTALEHSLTRFGDPETLSRHAAAYVAEQARTAIGHHGRFTFAVSGGHSPWAMFAALADEDMPWALTEIYQVDERVAPDGDPDRNLTHLRASLAGAPATVRPMPVNKPDLAAAANAYGSDLPARFDLVHLGLGPDGHTASLVPDDPVLEVTDRPVAVTLPYQNRVRMTLTYPALARAAQLLWLITGGDKQEPLARLLGGDRSIPAGRVEAASSLIFADCDAAPEAPGGSSGRLGGGAGGGAPSSPAS